MLLLLPKYTLRSRCKNMGPETYVTYALVDPTCERVLAEYPLGCENRVCSTTDNLMVTVRVIATWYS